MLRRVGSHVSCVFGDCLATRVLLYIHALAWQQRLADSLASPRGVCLWGHSLEHIWPHLPYTDPECMVACFTLGYSGEPQAVCGAELTAEECGL